MDSCLAAYALLHPHQRPEPTVSALAAYSDADSAAPGADSVPQSADSVDQGADSADPGADYYGEVGAGLMDPLCVDFRPDSCADSVDSYEVAALGLGAD